jgi:hypothetical protein
MTDWRDTPIFILNHDRLDLGFRDLLVWLRRAQMTAIRVVDSGSTYPPLLDFYDSSAMRGITLIRAENLGYEAIWKMNLPSAILLPGQRYILTDADVVPDPACPLDLVHRMHEVADRFAPAKVGPAIRIDNLPECFAQRDHMRLCEADYWRRPVMGEDGEQVGWDAALDTTFALYEREWERWPLLESGGVRHIRLAAPYLVNHIPWFSDSANLSAEERYYRAHVAPNFSSSCPQPVVE